jgi:hypothetical protein
VLPTTLFRFIIQPVDLEHSPVGKIGLAFANALASGDFESAHRMLVSSLRDDLQPHDLKAQYDEMTSYWTAPADKIELSLVSDANSDWRGKEVRGAGWAFVAINSLACSSLEGIYVVVMQEGGQNFIGDIVWGRP